MYNKEAEVGAHRKSIILRLKWEEFGDQAVSLTQEDASKEEGKALHLCRALRSLGREWDKTETVTTFDGLSLLSIFCHHGTCERRDGAVCCC